MDNRERAAAEGAAADLRLQALNDKMAPNLPPTPFDPACENGAIARCCFAYVSKLKSSSENGMDRLSCLGAAERAYSKAMPPLNGNDNIRDFIACVAHGLLIDAIENAKSTKLLYAAQVAHGAQKNLSNSNRPGRPFSGDNM